MYKSNQLTISLIVTNVGLVLALLGFSLIIFNQPLDENESIRNTNSTGNDPNGERTYTITNEDIRQTRDQLLQTDGTRAQNRQYGKIIANPGVVLLISGIISLLIFKRRLVNERKISPADIP